MKRSLSLVLALVMILGSFSTVFAAEATAVEKAGAFLNEKGILSGYAGSGDLGLKDNLLRQDTLVLVARLLGEFDEAKAHKGEVTYEDVKDKTYVPLAAWAKENNTFVGHSDVKFGFGENLKAQEYAKVLLTALGYKVAPNGDSDIKWADALAKAKEFGILADVKVEDATEITRGEMALMTVNALGVTMKGSKETLADKLGIKMPAAEELKVEEVRTENLAEIVVELSNAKLVKNKEALTNPANYRLNNDNIKVHNVDVEGNDLVLTLVPYGKVDEQGSVSPLIKDKKYDLTIRNIDKKVDKTYKDVVAKDNVIPAVEKVEFIGTHGIKITTNEPINTPQERNFRIGDKRTSMIIEQYGREIILTPYHNASFDKDATELVIEELRDFANYKSVKTTEKMELVKDTTKPEVVEAYRSGSKLTLVFDQDIYHDSINYNESRRELGNVSFVERRVTVYSQTAKKVDTNVAVYTFEREIPKNIEVLVEGVQNHSKETMEKQNVTPELNIDEYAPEVISDLTTTVRATGTEKKGELLNSQTKTLIVKFSKDIQELVDHIDGKKTINLADFFRLYELEVANRNELIIKNNADVKITIDATETKSDRIGLIIENVANGKVRVNNDRRDYDYVLEVRDLTDRAGNRMVREYIDFQILPKSTNFNVSSITVGENSIFNRKDTEVKVVFNGYVDKASAENETNYYINGKVVFDEAIVENDGKTVTLVKRDMTNAKFVETYGLDKDDKQQQIVLEISPRVKNLAKDAQVDERFWNLRSDLDKDGNASTKVSDVETLINKIPAVAKLENKTAVTAAKVAYDALSPTEKVLVDAKLVKKLNDAVDKIAELEKIAKEEADKEEKENLEAAEKAVKAAKVVLEAAEEEVKAAKAAETAAKAAQVVAQTKVDELVGSDDAVAIAEANLELSKAKAAVADAEKAVVDANAAVEVAQEKLEAAEKALEDLKAE